MAEKDHSIDHISDSFLSDFNDEMCRNNHKSDHIINLGTSNSSENFLNKPDKNCDSGESIDGSSDNCNECYDYSGVSDTDTQTNELFPELRNIRSNYAKNVIIGHLNVNCIGPKIIEVKELQNSCKFDVLVLSETKLDKSFKQETLDIDGYSCVRQDKRSNSGGLLAYISKDIPYSVGTINVCNDEIECCQLS